MELNSKLKRFKTLKAVRNKLREELFCAYSGLPSVKSYETF